MSRRRYLRPDTRPIRLRHGSDWLFGSDRTRSPHLTLLRLAERYGGRHRGAVYERIRVSATRLARRPRGQAVVPPITAPASCNASGHVPPNPRRSREDPRLPTEAYQQAGVETMLRLRIGTEAGELRSGRLAQSGQSTCFTSAPGAPGFRRIDVSRRIGASGGGTFPGRFCAKTDPNVPSFVPSPGDGSATPLWVLEEMSAAPSSALVR
jgi:hypothetical protein